MVSRGCSSVARCTTSGWLARCGANACNSSRTVAATWSRPTCPWLWHELPDGTVDLTGRTHEQRDLAGFIDLAAEMDLYVVARPGPFIMAEIKNEGMPYRVYDAPGVLPTTWDGATDPDTHGRLPLAGVPRRSPGVVRRGDASHRRAAVAPRRATSSRCSSTTRSACSSWVTNSPDLTDVVCNDLAAWAVDRWGTVEASRRLGAPADDAAAVASALRTPAETVSLPLHHALGLYSRERYRRYVSVLRAEAEKHGVAGVPFLINVHGTAERRGRSYPIGLSQLLRDMARRATDDGGVRPLPRRPHRAERPGPLPRQRVRGRRARRRPAADLAGVRGRHRGLQRRPLAPQRTRSHRAQDPALPRPGQPPDQLLPLRRRPQPAARRARSATATTASRSPASGMASPRPSVPKARRA